MLSKLERALAEELFETRAGVVQLGKDEAAVVVHVASRIHAIGGVTVVQSCFIIALAQRNLTQRAIGAKRPGVVRAAKELSGVAAGLPGDARAFVRAAVVQNLHGVVGVAHHQDRLGADCGAEIVARIRDLAVVADINPGVGEQVLHLEVKHLLVDVDVAMDLGFPDQVADGFDVAAVSIHRHLRIVTFAVSLDTTLLPGNAAACTIACNCEEFGRPCQPRPLL